MDQNYLNETQSFLRKSISEEELAISVYLDRQIICQKYSEYFRDAGNEEMAAKFDTIAYTLNDILNEEKVHVGQLREMLSLIGVEYNKEKEGSEEAKEDIKKFESFSSVARKLRRYVKD